LDYFNRGLSLAVEINNDQAKANTLQGLGVAYRLLNRLDDALRNYRESLAIKQRIGDKRGMGVSLDEIGMVEQMSGRHDSARRHFQEALKIQREIADKNGTALSLLNLGNLAYDSGRYDDALSSTRESLQLYQDLGNEQSQSQCLDNIGSSYFAKGDYDNALTYYERALQLREKTNVPKEIAGTLQNLGETTANLGQYDKAVAYYVRALDLARKAGDARLTAFISANLGSVFEHQGRYGAALGARQDAITALRQANDQTRWMAEVQAAYGHSLSLVMRGDDARKELDEALQRARALKDDPLVATVTGYIGDNAFYAGDYRSARSLYEQASNIAGKTADKRAISISRYNLALVTLRDRRFGDAVSAFKRVRDDAQRLRLRYLATSCSALLGEAYLGAKDKVRARQELEAARREARSFGLLIVEARAAHNLATLYDGEGDPRQATSLAEQASRLVQQIRDEAKSDSILEREDLKPIRASATLAAR
jgi:tetratricopeptide (TPR) repeat protein